jgi:hypothetical protein
MARSSNPLRSMAATARLTLTLSMRVRPDTSLADSGANRPSTAMTRHSGIERPNRAWYSRASDPLIRLLTTDSL